MRSSAGATSTARDFRRTLAFCLLLAGPVAGAQAQTADDPTALSLEELLQVKVYSASKFAQKMTEAPASVTVVTADDIRTYGYRTLADLLKSVRSLYVSYDRNYAYLGVRGFERPGDYDARILLLVDGARLNDTIYDTASIGTEFPVDVELIERVEIVRGPGSSIYGSNAFFAVLNVITKQGRDLGGAQASAELGSFGTDKQRLSYGARTNGADWLLSASRYRSQGQDLYFPEHDEPAKNNGIAEDRDGDRSEKLFGKLSAGGLSLMGGHSRRRKDIPTASYETAFNQDREQTVDQWTFADLRYERALGSAWTLSPHLFFGDYRYEGWYPYAGELPTDPIVVNVDLGRAQWWGTEVKLLGRIGAHKLLTGIEYQDNFRQDQANFDLGSDRPPFESLRHSRRQGVYVQDEMPLTGRLLLNLGLRYDDYSTAGSAFNPRAALVWNLRERTSLKALYGTAFRAPNNYELYYEGSPNVPNPDVEPEHIRSYELIAEHALSPNFRLTADAYFNRIRDLIDQQTLAGDDGMLDTADDTFQFRNLGRAESRGVELEAERAWSDDRRLRASYAWQLTRDLITGAQLSDSPRHLAKLNATAPVAASGVRAGAELQYVSRRKTLAGGDAGTAVVANLTLSMRTLAQRLELSASVYNLFDRAYADPARPEHAQAVIPQDGRSLRVKLTYGF